MAQPTYVSPERLEELKRELEYLRTVKRREVAQRIQEAARIGGTVDNAEYDLAKSEQAFVEGRIEELERLIKNAVVIPEKRRRKNIVDVGSTVVVEREDGTRQEFTIVGSTEADPAHGKISNVSPIGQALLGRRLGQTVQVQVPAGTLRLKIVEIR